MVNQVKTIYPVIGDLSNLTVLNAFNNKLVSLPSSISRLKKLAILILDRNQLASLPSEIGDLQNLTLLSLANNQLMTLPAELGSLKNIQRMIISSNQLTTLPQRFVQLQTLQKLNLDGNKFSKLPQSLMQLKNLQLLHLGDNQLSTLNGISQLKSLEELYNRLADAPELNETHVFELGKYRFDSKRLTIQMASGETKKLTLREAELLKLLCQNKNKLITKTSILMHVWGDDSFFNSRSMDVFISHLRKYLKDVLVVKQFGNA
ncbi:MAG TPA: hypothetical protein DCS93_27795 [Microscillaceae bacterium]|nr:hypothetical protein [Microscillaceae bacterium]